MSVNSLPISPITRSERHVLAEHSSYIVSDQAGQQIDRLDARRTHFPTVTLVIPTYNEATQIERIVTGFLHTGYPHLIEVLIIDGGSTDGTQVLVQRLADLDPRVRLLHNRLKIQSAALNIGIAEMQGEVFIRADGHSAYAPDYIEQCIATLLETHALNVGGSPQYVATTPFQAGISLASRSILGSGGSRHRNPTYNGSSDSVSFGCCWKSELDKLDSSRLRPTPYSQTDADQQFVRSFFDLDQVTNQDSEINVRFRKRNPQAIYVSSRIKAWYFPRKTWQGLRKQYFNYGRGRCRTAALHPDLSPPRAKLPLLAGAGVVLLGIVDLFVLRSRLRTPRLFLIASVIPFLESMRVTLKHRRNFKTEIWRGSPAAMPSLVQRCWYCSVALWTMTPAYLAGYVYQLIRRTIFRIDGW